MAVSPEVAALLQRLHGQYQAIPRTLEDYLRVNYPNVRQGENAWYDGERLMSGEEPQEIQNKFRQEQEMLNALGPAGWLETDGVREGIFPLASTRFGSITGNRGSEFERQYGEHFNSLTPEQRARFVYPGGQMIGAADNPFGIDLFRTDGTTPYQGMGNNNTPDSFMDMLGLYLVGGIAGAGALANAGMFSGLGIPGLQSGATAGALEGGGGAIAASGGGAGGGNLAANGLFGTLSDAGLTLPASITPEVASTFASSIAPFPVTGAAVSPALGTVDSLIKLMTPTPASLATTAASQLAQSGGGSDAQAIAADTGDYTSRNSATALTGQQKQTSVFDALLNMAAKTGSQALIQTALGNKNALSNIPLVMGGQILGNLVSTATGLTGNALANLLKSAGSGLVDAAMKVPGYAGGMFSVPDMTKVISGDSGASRDPNDPYWNMTADAGGTMTDAGGGNYIDENGLPRNAAGELVIEIVGDSGTSGGSQDMANGSGDTWSDFLANIFSGAGNGTNTTFAPNINIDTSGIANAISGQNSQLFNAINQVSQQTGQSMDQILQGMQAGDQNIINAIQQQTSGISSGLNQGFGNLSNYFTQGLNNLGNNFQTGFDYLGSGLNNMGTQFGQGLNNVASGINNLGQDFSQSYNNLAGGLSNLGEMVNQGNADLRNSIGTDLSNLENTFSNSFGHFGDQVGQGFDLLSNRFMQGLGGVQNSFDSGLDSLGVGIQNLMQQDAQQNSQMSNQLSGLQSGLSNLGSGLQSGFSGLGNAFGSALDRLGTTQNLGTMGAAALGYKAAKDQIDAFERTQDKYLGVGQPYRGRLNQSYQPGFSMQNEPGYADAMNQSMSSLLRGLSASGGSNPFGNPGGLAEANRYALSTTALPALSNYRSGLLGAGSMGLPTAGQAGLSAAGAAQGPFQQLGAGLGALTAPQNDLASLLKQLKGSGISLNLGSGF